MHNIIAQKYNTIVSEEYTPHKSSDKTFQSEEELEKKLINDLVNLGYEYAKIHDEKSLKENLRTQIENLNDYRFSDNEWNRFYAQIANKNDDLVDKTKLIQETQIFNIKLDNNETKNIKIIETNDDKINKNSLQVINQYSAISESGEQNRYDVSILVNGLPLVHIELKRRGVLLKNAFNQIKRYSTNSFKSGDGLFLFVQMFIISNGTESKYYSNTTRSNHEQTKITKEALANSFEFTSYWTDSKNNIINDLEDFTKYFLDKRTLLNVLTKYCVFDTKKNLLILRPYQICACEKILNKIDISHNNKLYGKKESGGYIWHTTGSGKTLTSFKVAQLASQMNYIKKVLFVVDRKDLDFQTCNEYNKFQEGAVNNNKNTKELANGLQDISKKILVTTIQKLNNLVNQYKQHSIFDDEIVIIFDECHRSQFGEMHKNIIKAFKKYYIFGFTGTPILAENAKDKIKTTESLFGLNLHIYSIVNAINDKNVLPFKIDYINTIKEKQEIEEAQVIDIDKESALCDDRRINLIVKYILQNFDAKTKRNEFYCLDTKRLNGFNAIFASSSIDFAKKYYEEFKRQMDLLPDNKKLKIAIIYSASSNNDISEENNESTEGLEKNDIDFLESAISDYNAIFNTNFSTKNNFENYYKEVSKRMKERDLDLLIVVNMFLTGFDSKTINTLFVDKNLEMHGLLQAFSRTNRIINTIKSHGNIVCFRNLEEKVNESLQTFGDENAKKIVILKSFEEYIKGYIDTNGAYVRGYEELTNALKEQYELNALRQLSQEERKEFIKLFNEIIKLENILHCFDEFSDKKDDFLNERDKQDYQSYYLELKDEFKRNKNAKENINDDVIFEIELIKQVEANVDFILNLIKQHKGEDVKSIKATIERYINASPSLRNKRDLIMNFIDKINQITQTNIESEFKRFANDEYDKELANLITTYKLNETAKKYMKNSFAKGEISFLGTEYPKILPPMPLIASIEIRKENEKKKEAIKNDLEKLFDKYYSLLDVAS